MKTASPTTRADRRRTTNGAGRTGHSIRHPAEGGSEATGPLHERKGRALLSSRLSFVLSLFLIAPLTAMAQVAPLRGVLDVSTAPPAAGALIEDQDVFVDDLSGLLVEDSLGASIAAESAIEVVGLLQDANATLFVIDTARRIGGLDATPRDVVSYDGVGYAIAFDGGQAGLPSSVRIDALARGTDGALAMSFDGFVDLGGVVVADEDLVRWDGSAFAIVFDGSVEGIPVSLDLDAASYGGGGQLYLSFDGAGQVGGVDFTDQDVLEFDPALATWSASLAIDLANDTSLGTGAVGAADLQAMHVPEPGFALALCVALYCLAVALRWRASGELHPLNRSGFPPPKSV